MIDLSSVSDWSWLGSVFLRLLVAVVLGGLVGYEREQANRPAGFRTHILVSLGSALVMVTAEYMTKIYSPQINLDPTRLGAQVVSGIGFLGAGTIIRNGSSVKGLTTAASLWAVCCIGLACGSGFYAGAILATLFTVVTLITLKRLEKHLSHKHGETTLLVQLSYYGQDVLDILKKADDLHLVIRKMQLLPADEDENGVRLRLGIARASEENKARLILAMKEMSSVRSISDE
ncbi:MAG: MgtC/SapB family protein [Clostridiaceae bacterium]|nr:MgtC/SapB family protein [Clostridiaceae bacterium]